MRARLTDSLLGLVYLSIAVLIVVVAILVYDKSFTSSVDVSVDTGATGNALAKGSDVKVHGVPVGTVSAITSTDRGARVTLRLDPDQAGSIPDNSTVRLLPKTLFGERFVALVPPTSDPGPGLTDGDRVREDSSPQAVELEQVFDRLLPLLTAVQPEKIAASLGELSQALRGNGSDIGTTMAQFADYLRKLNPQVPQMADDFAALGRVADTYADAAPDLISALDDLTVTSATLVDQRKELEQTFARVITASDTTTGFVASNQDTIEVLSGQGRKALAAVAPYAEEFPCLTKAMRQYIPKMETALGVGTAEPGLHVKLSVVPARAKYVPGKDAPKYLRNKQPTCPYVTGQAGSQPIAATSGSTGIEKTQPAAVAGIGALNSPAENQLTAELYASSVGLLPSQFPTWGSLLLGPTVRGAEVSLE